jgi:hypothetical protein
MPAKHPPSSNKNKNTSERDALLTLLRTAGQKFRSLQISQGKNFVPENLVEDPSDKICPPKFI